MTQDLDIRFVAFGLIVLAILGALFAPAMPFTIDGVIYTDMAKAMSENGSFAIASNGGVDGAPALSKEITFENNGLAYPLYPSGYAIIAAPFYALMGVRGLLLMNGLAFLGCAFLVYHISRRFFADRFIHIASLTVFVVATFVTNYVTAIWPHMLALLTWLGAIACAISAAEETSDLRRTWMLIASGLVIGLGISIRIDSILIYMVLFIWLRVFSRPADRLAPLWLSSGLLPGLVLSALMNAEKFGIFTPLSYGPSSGATQLGSYAVILTAGGLSFLALWLLNFPAIFSTLNKRLGPRNLLLAGVTATGIALFIAGGFIFDTLYGVYVLVFNLQAHNAYTQAGVELNEYGHLLFWGYPKKALIQSLPYLPLLLIPGFWFFRGKHVKAVSLCLLAIAAPITFYALNQWFGGGSYNLRYFIPTLPFIAILSAAALHDLTKVAGSVSRPVLLFAGVSAAGLYVGMQALGQAVPSLYAPAALYPQWIIAFLCACFVVSFLHFRRPTIAKATLVVSSFALIYGALVSLADESGHEKARAELRGYAQVISSALPQNALVLTTLPVLTMHAQHNGTSIMIPLEDNIDETIRATDAFARAGRCIYFHNPIVTDLLEPHLPDGTISKVPSWAGREKFPGDAKLAFFTLSSQKDACSF